MSDNSFNTAQTIAAYKRLFLGSADGKAVLEDLSAENFMDSSTFDPANGASDYNQGRRDAILSIFQKLNTNLIEYLTQNVPMEDH